MNFRRVDVVKLARVGAEELRLVLPGSSALRIVSIARQASSPS